MVRTYKKKNNSRIYPSKALLKQAVEAVKRGMELKTASKTFNTPRTTLKREILSGGKSKPEGGQLIFTDSQEKCFMTDLYLSERRFLYTIEEIRSAAYLYIVGPYGKKLQRKHKQNKKYPSSWDAEQKASKITCYKRRHPDLSLRVAQNLSAVRTEAFNEARVHHFFEELSITCDHKGPVIPKLIYNCDETGLSFVFNSSKRVIVKRATDGAQSRTWHLNHTAAMCQCHGRSFSTYYHF